MNGTREGLNILATLTSKPKSANQNFLREGLWGKSVIVEQGKNRNQWIISIIAELTVHIILYPDPVPTIVVCSSWMKRVYWFADSGKINVIHIYHKFSDNGCYCSLLDPSGRLLGGYFCRLVPRSVNFFLAQLTRAWNLSR